MNEPNNDFAKVNAQIVAEWPEWKRQYDLRVSSYGPDRTENESAIPVEAPAVDAEKRDR